MYVTPAHRSRGIAGALLVRSRPGPPPSATRRCVSTPDRSSLALELYGRAGYTSIDPYNDNPHATFWGEKRLGPTVRAQRTGHDEGRHLGPCGGESVH